MAIYNRPPKKKDKGPDEFISFFDHLVRYFLMHKNKLFAVIILGVLAFGAYGYYLHRQSGQVRKFATLYGEAVSAPKGEALQVWEKIDTKNPPLSLRQVIAIQIGGIFSQEDKWKDAGQAYLRAADSQDELIRYLGQWARAIALENANNLDEASVVYEKIAVDEGNPYRDYARLGQARVLAAKGQAPEAEAILNQLIQEGKESPQAVQASAITQLLAMKAEKSQTTETKPES